MARNIPNPKEPNYAWYVVGLGSSPFDCSVKIGEKQAEKFLAACFLSFVPACSGQH